MIKIRCTICIYIIFNIKLLLGVVLISGTDALKLINNPDVIFISGDSHEIYESSHIVNSIEMYAHHLHHSDGQGTMPCAPLFRCIESTEKYLRSKGVRNDQLVIAYDNFKGPNASGVYAFFESIGHKNLKFLNGGMDAIKMADPKQIEYKAMKDKRKALSKRARVEKSSGNIEEYNKLRAESKLLRTDMKMVKVDFLPSFDRGKEKKRTASNYTINISQLNTHFVADKYEVKVAMEDILKHKENSNYVIIDTRSIIEIIGERKMDNVARGGHIPGATFIEWKNFTDFVNRKSFKTKPEMQSVFDRLHISKDKIIYAYCQVGVGRGSHVISALRLLGYKNVKVFSGSWDTWGNDMSLPITR